MNRETDEPHSASVSHFEDKASLAKFVDWMHGQHELVRVASTATIGTVLGRITYEIIYFINWTEPRASDSWTLAFTIGVLRQHHLHRTPSFPQIDVPYGTSLRWDALASILVATASTVLNSAQTERVGLHRRNVWAACLTVVAVLEYAFLKLFVFRGHRSRETGQ